MRKQLLPEGTDKINQNLEFGGGKSPMKLELGQTFEEGCCQLLLLISQRLCNEAGSERTKEVKDAVISCFLLVPCTVRT